MKPRHILETHGLATPSHQSNKFIARRWSIGALALAFVVFATSSWAQAIRFQVPQYRVTVPLNSTNTAVLTNSVNLHGVTNATFSISSLPVGAGAYLTDTNSVLVTSVDDDTNLWLVVNTTNIAQGTHTFSLNASGFDTNGAPVTNYMFLLIQAAHIWNGATANFSGTNGPFGFSNAWSTPISWLGGVPGPGSDVVFTEIGAQTNAGPEGFYFTNSYVDLDLSIASLRFSHTAETNSYTTNEDARPRTHGLHINAGRTLTITGTNGFSIMRDVIDDFKNARVTDVNIFGGVGSRLVISNASANFNYLIANSQLSDKPTLNATNLETSVMHVNRVALGDFQLFPNYRNYNDAHDYSSRPSRFCLNFHMPRTNIIRALYADADGYGNEFTRAYGLTFLNSETRSVGSGVNSFLNLGQSNAFFMDGVCFIRANHSTGNGGFVRFNPVFPNATALFRNTNGGRMSIFAVSDDGGTSGGEGNVKALIDFAQGNGFIDLLADKLIIARDRSLVASNSSVNVTGDLTIGRGIVDVNTAILGFQEASSKTNWYEIDPAPADNAYFGFCRGNLFVTNGGVVRINRTLTLGFTADTNAVAAAHQYDTYGQVTIYSNSVVAVSNVLVDTGLNFYDFNGRDNWITINQGGILSVTNSVGGAPGLPLDRLSMTAGILQLPVNATRTNVFVRELLNLGTVPSVIKVTSLAGVTTYPTNIPLISYETATPFLAADMSSISGGVQGYIINNTDNKTIDLFLTTNAPKNLVWRGNINNDWDLTTKNWGLITGGPDTNFSMGDIATFNDNSTVNDIDINVVVVPNQTAGTNGVTVTNTIRDYKFTPNGGAIAGTAQIVKMGGGKLTFDAAESGPISVLGGTLDGSGNLGATAVGTNSSLIFAGTINNGLTSTGTVVLSGTMASGALAIRGGSFVNLGIINTVVPNGSAVISGGSFVSNAFGAEINIDSGANGNNYVVRDNSTLANAGLIRNIRGRLNLSASPDGALLYGTGSLQDPDGGFPLTGGNDGRLAINPLGIFSPGELPYNSIGTFSADCRFDLNNTPAQGVGVLRIEVDYSHPQTNDMVEVDRWNNITGMLLMTNINPGAGTFSLGEVFQVLVSNNGLNISNVSDVIGPIPLIWPPLPKPGLQWGTAEFRNYGRLSVTNSPLVWNGTASGTWDTNTANTTWQSGLAYFDNGGALFDDSASGTTVITILPTNAVAPAGYAIVTNMIVGVSTNIFNTVGPAMSPGIVISNTAKDYTFTGNGKISGLTGLYKAGTGTLTILTTNDFVGHTFLYGGTVVITNVAGLGANGSVGGASGIQNELFIGGSTIRYVGNINATLPRATVIEEADAVFDVASPTNELTLSTLLGPGSITKIGVGTVVLNSSGSFAGGTTVSNGTLRINNATAAGSNSVTVVGAALFLSGNGFTFTNAIAWLGAGNKLVITNTHISSGNWSGNGSLSLSNTSTFSISAPMTNFTGSIVFTDTANHLRFNNATNNNFNAGSAGASFNLGNGTGSISNVNGGVISLGALSGGANTTVAGRASNSVHWPINTTYTIGANGQSTIYHGKIINGLDAVAVVKEGTGTLALNGANTYTGGTTVSNGTLAGNGSIVGPLTVTANGTIAPGNSVGKFSVTGTATLSGTTRMELDRIGGVSTNDQLAATTITGGGALIVTNIGPGIFNRATFKLFSVPVTGFTSLVLPTNGPTGTYVWQNTLSTDGSIKLISGGILNTNSPTLTNSYSVGTNALTLTWPETHIGWNLQAQTNALSVGISNNWSVVAGSSATNFMVLPINSAAPTVFYRLSYP